MKPYLFASKMMTMCFLQCWPFVLQAQVGRDILPPPARMAPPGNFFERPIDNPIDDQTNDETDDADLEEPFSPNSFVSSEEVSTDLKKIASILDFWFGTLSDPAYFPKDKVSVWFAANPEVDRQIRENFSEDVSAALNGEYNDWRETPKGRLALILLLDQFTRHIYRNQPQEFMADPMARGLVLEGLQKGDDRDLYPIEKAFFYLPLEHAENIRMQNLAVSLYQKLLREAPAPIKPQMSAFLDYAFLHREQISRFGRFPHRNAVLKRAPTSEEMIFLNQWRAPSYGESLPIK